MRIEITVTEDREGSDARSEWENGRRLFGWVEVEQDLADFTAEHLFRTLMDFARYTSYLGDGGDDER